MLLCHVLVTDVGPFVTRYDGTPSRKRRFMQRSRSNTISTIVVGVAALLATFLHLILL